MKKTIALLLCSATSYSFGLNMPLKPSSGVLSSCWNNLSYANKATLFATASIATLAGILYAIWPISEQFARKNAEQELLYRQQAIYGQIQHEKNSDPELIKTMFTEIGNPAIFHFGSFLNRNAFHVLVGTNPHENLDTEETKTILSIALINAKTTQEKRFEYNFAKNSWEQIQFVENGNPTWKNLPRYDSK